MNADIAYYRYLKRAYSFKNKNYSALIEETVKLIPMCKKLFVRKMFSAL